MEEENKTVVIDDDEDFADAKKPVAEEPAEAITTPASEAVVEETPEEPKEEQPEDKIEDKPEYEYANAHLAGIEEARKTWVTSYKKSSRIKTLISVGALLAIILSYFLPSVLITDDATRSTLTLAIAGGTAVIGLGSLIAYNVVSKKKTNALISDYFKGFYGNLDAFVFEGTGVTDLSGSYDKKIDHAEVTACGLYPNLANIGSRDSINFKYEGTEFALCDMAAQKDNGKSLATVFVGKYLRAHNTCKVSPEGLVIYFKGNERALPPLVLESLPKLSENKSYAVYGSAADKKVLKKSIETILKKIKTNKLLVDVAIAIKPGRTYMALGYEDTLMVLPSEKPFNPAYAEAYKAHMAIFLELGAKLNAGAAEE